MTAAQKLTRDRLTVACYAMVGLWAFYLYFVGPATPHFSAELGVDLQLAGVTSLMLGVGLIASGLVSPPMVRALGRGPGAVACAAALAAGAFALAVAPAFWAVLAAVALCTLAGAMLMNLSTAALTDRHGAQASTAITEGQAIAAWLGVVSPLLIGGMVAIGLGWRAAATTVAVVAAVVALALLTVRSLLGIRRRSARILEPAVGQPLVTDAVEAPAAEPAPTGTEPDAEQRPQPSTAAPRSASMGPDGALGQRKSAAPDSAGADPDTEQRPELSTAAPRPAEMGPDGALRQRKSAAPDSAGADPDARLGPQPSTARFVWSLVGIVAAAGAEMSLNFWGGVLIAENSGAALGTATASLAALIAGIAVGRTVGAFLTRTFEVRPLVWSSIGLALAGFLTVWLSPSLALSVTALFVTGLGLALLFPLMVGMAMRNAGERTDWAAAVVSMVMGATLGAAPFLLAAVAGMTGVSRAFLLVPCFLVVGLVAIGRAAPPRGSGMAESSGSTAGG